MDISTGVIVILACSGILVGFINTLAGGATVISMTVFMMLGLPVTMANGTNRLPVILQTLTSSINFRRQKMLDIGVGLKISAPMIVGAVIGAEIASTINQAIFKICLGVVLFGVLAFILASPARRLNRSEPKPLQWKHYLWFLLIGFYDGYIYVGLGYLILGALIAGMGYDIMRANALKGFVVLVTIPFSFLIFALHGQVHYTYGLIHSVGNIIGAYVASRYASGFGIVFLKWFLVGVILVTIGDMFGLISISGLIKDFLQ